MTFEDSHSLLHGCGKEICSNSEIAVASGTKVRRMYRFLDMSMTGSLIGFMDVVCNPECVEIHLILTG